VPKRKKDERVQAAVYTIPVTLTVFEWARLLQIVHRRCPDIPLLNGLHKAVSQDGTLSEAVKWLHTYDEADRLVRLYGRTARDVKLMLSSDFQDHELKVLATQTSSWGRQVAKKRKSRRLAGDKKVAK